MGGDRWISWTSSGPSPGIGRLEQDLRGPAVTFGSNNIASWVQEVRGALFVGQDSPCSLGASALHLRQLRGSVLPPPRLAACRLVKVNACAGMRPEGYSCFARVTAFVLTATAFSGIVRHDGEVMFEARASSNQGLLKEIFLTLQAW
jgi:hypothetical protein